MHHISFRSLVPGLCPLVHLVYAAANQGAPDMFKSISLIVIATLFSFGCDSAQKQDQTASAVSPGMVNDACPISSRPLKTGCPTSTWDGVTLGFCCNGCKKRFDSMDVAQKNAEIAKVTSAS